ncbi:family 16 glycosylhydrolase [Lactococcus lactis]|uniref:family 16 glycosylhydrolase n=1 Tax=Lactococcus lactis TaxID=1358 RepID=UPI0009BCEF62|nr:family 16 glycosylhydrolase [Lactococcus lactis]
MKKIIVNSITVESFVNTNVSGIITGVFLHLNSPHQEIDIKFLGKDTTKMLINIFFNPGIEGSKLEYGYRGTPVVISLDFDASKNHQLYEIHWESFLLERLQ